MTIQQKIETSKIMKAIRIPVLYQWLGYLDGEKYLYPEDEDTELKIKEPEDNLYDLYVTAINDFYSGDLAAYTASAIMFEHEYEAYKKRMRRRRYENCT